MGDELQGQGFVDESEDDVILPGELATEDDEPEEEEPEAIETPEGEQQAEGEPPAQPVVPPEQQPITMTQEQLNKLIADRLERDRRVREQEQAAVQQQQATVQQQEQQWTNYYNQLLTTHFNDRYQFYANHLGLDEETAKARAASEAEVNAKRDYQIEAINYQIHQSQQQQIRQQQTQQQREVAIQRVSAYERDKAAAMRNPMVARYINQIDQFSGRGTKLNFEVAKRYVLGSVMEAELGNARTTEQQRTMANINSRKGIGVMGGSQPGGAATGGNTLTAAEKRMAAALGISPKDYATHKNKPKR